MKTKYWILILILVSVLSMLLGLVLFLPNSVGFVNVNLVNANSDFAGGNQAWEFKVNNKEISPGSEIKVFHNFKISVVEFSSRKIVDELDITSLIKENDLITYAYYGSASSEGESPYIYIKHKDGSTREVKININNQ